MLLLIMIILSPFLLALAIGLPLILLWAAGEGKEDTLRLEPQSKTPQRSVTGWIVWQTFNRWIRTKPKLITQRDELKRPPEGK